MAVQDVSFEIEPTTLKMLCGLIHPSAGEARGLFSELADLARKRLADLS